MTERVVAGIVMTLCWLVILTGSIILAIAGHPTLLIFFGIIAIAGGIGWAFAVLMD